MVCTLLFFVRIFSNVSSTADVVTNTLGLKPKTKTNVGWVEGRNPTFLGLCWVERSETQPTIILNPSVLM